MGSAARAIRCGEAELMITGGVENMTRAPFVIPKADSAFSRANAVYDITIDSRCVNPLMGLGAERACLCHPRQPVAIVNIPAFATPRHPGAL